MILLPEMLVAATGCKLTTAQAVAGPLGEAMAARFIDTPIRMAHFIAQCAHESALFEHAVESLNYSAEALVVIWPKRFYLPPAEPAGRENAQAYGRTAEHQAWQTKIAVVAYSDRMGNGPRETLDGWKYRGRGYLQLTGRDAYQAFCNAEPGLRCMDFPDLISEPVGAAKSAAWFWQTHGCNMAADTDSVAAVTRIVNGGAIGINDRAELTKRARDALGN